MDGQLQVNSTIAIPKSEFTFSFSRSPGPGGQHVNKTNTKVTLRWDVGGSEAVPEAVKRRLKLLFRSRMTVEDELVLQSHRYRDRPRNIDDCLEKLKAMLLAAAEVPRPRKPTRTPPGAKRRRLENKRRRAETKRSRSGRNWKDD